MKKTVKIIAFALIFLANNLHAQNNTLWSKGSNTCGQLGLGYSAIPKTPTNLNFGKEWKLISLTKSGAMGIKTDGTLWAWGYNQYGQLGLSVQSTSEPIQVGSDKNWANLYSNNDGLNMIGLKTDGTLWAWGYNQYGQLGLGYSGNVVNSPLQIGRSNNWISVFRNNSSNFCIKSDGTLWAWGSNSNGHLGSGNENKIYSPTKIGTSNQWVEIQSDGFSTIGLKSNGTLWACGGNGFGELGQNNTISILEFTQIGINKDWISFRFNGTSAFAIKSNGTLFSWGYNGNGCLGLNNLTKSEILSPTQIGTDTKWEKIISNYNYNNMSVYAIKTDGTLWAWGNNSYSQLGLGDNNSKSIPVQIGIDSNWTSIQIAKNGFVIAQKKDGTLWSWGRNISWQLGLGYSGKDVNSPRKIGNDNDWQNCYNFQYSSGVYALKTDGTLWGWGEDVINNTLNPVNQFTKVDKSLNWQEISTGSEFSIALKNDGTLWSWGNNSYGQLGLGDRMERNIPTQIGGDTNWVAIKTGVSHSLGLKKDGTIWTWGSNKAAQLGIGYKRDTIISKPVQIGTEKIWKAISCGSITSFAIKKNGTLWGWGSDNQWSSPVFYQIAPLQIGTDTNWKIVSAGIDSILFSAIKTNNTLWMSYLIDQYDSKKHRYTKPFQIGTDKDWKNTSAGYSKIYALKNDQTLWSCNSDSLAIMVKCDNNKWTQFEASNYYCVGIQFDHKPYLIISWNGTISNLDSNNDWNSISSRFNNHFLGIRTKVNSAGSVKLLNENLLIYPNPTTGKLYITNAIGNLINYEIYDLNGKRIMIGKTQENINISTLSAGIYILKTNQSNFKFIKE